VTIPSSTSVKGRDKDIISGNAGEYFRLLNPNDEDEIAYYVTASASGYVSEVSCGFAKIVELH
jgi:hypothetical protein